MDRVRPRYLTAALLSGAVVAGCFVQPRSNLELLDLLWSPSGTPCINGSCRGENPCMRGTCIENTQCRLDVDDSLIPDDHEECTVDVCKGGVAQHEATPAA